MHCRHCGIPWKYDYEYCPACEKNYGGAVYPAKQTEAELRDIEALIEQIHRVFADVERGAGMTIHQAHLEGMAGPGDDKWIEAGAKDQESHWTEVPDWKLERGFSTLSFFNVEGWHFYLPAFMCWSLRNWRTSDSVTSDYVIWDLTLRECGFDELNMRRYESLNQTQSEAVYDYLDFFDNYSGQSDAAEGIQSYWCQFGRDRSRFPVTE